MKTMESSSSPYYNLSFMIIFLISLFFKQFLCQQSYLANDTCSDDIYSSTRRGYVCSDYLNSCLSFLTFRSKPPYDSPLKIAQFLGAEPSHITHLNNFVSQDFKIPQDDLVIVPVTCSCSGSIYQHPVLYKLKGGDTYFIIATQNYQGLTTCIAVIGQNSYGIVDLPIGTDILVPLRCVCPTKTQAINGTLHFLVYIVKANDTTRSIAKDFGVEEQSVLQANQLSDSSDVYPFTTILVPLNYKSCMINPLYNFCQPVVRVKFPTATAIGTGVGSGIAFLIIILVGFKAYKLLKKRRYTLCKEKFFKENGGLSLQQNLNENGGRVKLFTKEELETATDNYNRNRFLGQGGYGTVFKGMLEDGTTVAIKRSKQVEKNWIEQFINEVIILSQINHKNIVKLLGCCLETKFPMLVYEFVPNKTLSQHIHDQHLGELLPLSWENRLKIASEVAGAISYMHSAASIPIFHRDIKSMNILLDDNYDSKVSDFGTSRFVLGDQSHLTTKVQGTLGHIDPEYFRSSQFTEKSDVYSFGILIVEILTGKSPFNFAKDAGKNLIDYFISLEKENQLIEVLDIEVSREANIEIVHSVAKLAIKCLRLNGKKRPTMKQVYLELEGLRRSQECQEIVEESPSIRSASLDSASSSYDELTDESIISIDMECVKMANSL